MILHRKILVLKNKMLSYCQKKSNNFLDTTKLETLYPNVMNIKDSVRIIIYLINFT